MPRTKKTPTKGEKRAICVRMSAELHDLVVQDAETGDRTPPAQIRRILKSYYGLADDED